jgi:hypothetical protein
VLGAGTYWFELQNATVTNDDPTYWDMNGGPQQVSSSDLGYNPDPSGYAPGFASLVRSAPAARDFHSGTGQLSPPRVRTGRSALAASGEGRMAFAAMSSADPNRFADRSRGM